MTALSEALIRFKVDFDTSALARGVAATNKATADVRRRAETGLTTRGQAFTGLNSPLTLGLQAIAVGAAAAAVGVAALVHEMVGFAATLNDTSNRLGISTNDLQAWRLAGELAGVEAGQMDAALTRLSGQLAQNGSPSVRTFRSLGVAVRGANGEVRDMGAILADAAEPISRMGVAERNATLVRLLGRQGARLGPLFAQGARGVAAAREELQRLGGGLTPEATRNLAALDDSLDKANVAVTSLKGAIAGALAPAINAAVGFLSSAGGRVANLFRNTRLLEHGILALKIALVALAVVMAPIWVPAVISIAAVLAGVILLILAVDDLMTAFEGGRSVSGAFWNSIVQGIEDVINAVGQFVGLDPVHLGRFANAGDPRTAERQRADSAIKTSVRPGQALAPVTIHNNVEVNPKTEMKPGDIAREVRQELNRRDERTQEALGTAAEPVAGTGRRGTI